MAAPDPIWLFHFTHVDHLPTIIDQGLRPDTAMQGRVELAYEAGDPPVKARRRGAVVSVEPGGVVADYVPYYFAPRSPMLYKIKQGSVPSYRGTQHDLVYLCTTEPALRQHDLPLVATDRNAAVAYAEFSHDRPAWDDLVDWPLMRAAMWNNTLDDPDRMQRRMAECLAHGTVPWPATLHVGVATEQMRSRVTAVLQAAGSCTPVSVRPAWYY